MLDFISTPYLYGRERPSSTIANEKKIIWKLYGILQGYNRLMIMNLCFISESEKIVVIGLKRAF